MKLFCFPYAGGSKLIYKNWQQNLRCDIEVIAYEMSGRGKKILEPEYEDIDDAINKIFNDIMIHVEKGNYSFFGHSMGSYIVYKLTKKIVEMNLPKPSHLFLSGSKPPHLQNKDIPDHLLPEKDFIDLLKDYGGTPEDFFQNQELLDFFIPKLRSDFKIANYVIEDESNITPLDVKFTVLYGDNENDLTQKEVREWNKYTNHTINYHCINGSHFFIDENPRPVLSIVNTILIEEKENLCV